jgi:phosphomannomutase
MLTGETRDARLEAAFGPIAEGALETVDLTDGVRMIFHNDRIIHLRGSGNAPEMRCYTEAEALGIARKIGEAAIGLVAERF